MDRRQFLLRSSLAAAGAALPFKNLMAGHAFPGTFTDLRRNVGIYTERGGTMGWLAADDGFLVIDSQFSETAKNRNSAFLTSELRYKFKNTLIKAILIAN